MKTAIIATGSELISGLVQDSNSKFLAENLANLGFEPENIFICGDEKENIKKTIFTASRSADLIFITGGLGPTKDDQTKEAFAEVLDLNLIYSKKIEKKLKNIFCNHSSEMTSNNLSQAYIPAGAEIINNDKGTAPALKVEKENKTFYLLPGVPSELKYLFKNKILKELKKKSKNKLFIKEFNFIGIGESTLASEVDNLKLDPALKISYQAGRAEVKLRLKIDQNSQLAAAEKHKIIKTAAEKIKRQFSDFIYGEDQEDILDKVHNLLISKKLSIATAESFTGGLIAERLTSRAGSSQYFLGSIVAYNEKIKKEILEIESELLERYGVVSRECAKAMVENAARIFDSEIAAAATGAAGPAAHNGKSAGTMFVAIAYKEKIKILKLQKNYGRKMNRYFASQIVLFEIYKLIKESEEN
ncbi:competence/damage-inducible protein cinA [Halanaerobium saccharolyticum]|uniref:Putative competence-damage inducible protein n=1 Tax=Halanaerobium saccharolyticum TaxID=43595 RepID=A0A4V3G5X7_9FIRM|nr:competence/damage-inducible protein A [Halanaerobium saccharolyticum]RAK11177.1 competence/damage-inducible protein cinA [Halanaerobium saccharolyticum]TDW07028.1 competence/damage-inducible protein cinA [Halanaerobium saccharolyticum]TDX63793.1 competence/damage-inducible protein cinA [Halanaerobium saccharolyticum]